MPNEPEKPFPYRGEEKLRAAIEEALQRVIDPEMALDIVALGLVYGVEATSERVKVDLTMTSAACPVAELITDEASHELQLALGPKVAIEIAMVWDPPWGPERMSGSARAAMGWD